MIRKNLITAPGSVEVGDEIMVTAEKDGVRTTTSGVVGKIVSRPLTTFFYTSDDGLIHQSWASDGASIYMVRKVALATELALF